MKQYGMQRRVPEPSPMPHVVCYLCHCRTLTYATPTPEGTLGYVTCALVANSTKRRKKIGSSVAYKTIGTFLLQDKRHEDACGWATEMRNSGCAAVRHWPTLCFTHRTCKLPTPPPPPLRKHGPGSGSRTKSAETWGPCVWTSPY